MFGVNKKRNYDKLEKLKDNILNSDSKIQSIAKYLRDLEDDYSEAIKLDSHNDISDRLFNYYEFYPSVDRFLSSAVSNIEYEMRALKNDIDIEEAEKKAKKEEQKAKLKEFFGGC